MAKRVLADTTVPPLPKGTKFKDALRAFLKTPAPPTNIGRPGLAKRKRKGIKKKR